MLKNQMVSLGGILLFSALFMLSTVEGFGWFAWSVIMFCTFALQAFIAHTLEEAQTQEMLITTIEEHTIVQIMLKHLLPVMGVFLGSAVVLGIVMGMSYVVMIAMIGEPAWQAVLAGNVAESQRVDVYMSLAAIAAVDFLVALSLIYFYPLALARGLGKDNLNEAFVAIFSVFSYDVWKKSTHEKYFVYMSMLHINALGLFFVFGLVAGSMIFLPLAMMVWYAFVVYAGVNAVLAREVCDF